VRIMSRLKLILFVVLLVIGGCGTADDEGQDFGDLFLGIEGVVLTEEEHPGGWGRSDCVACHPIAEIHRVDRTGMALPLEDIREFVEEEGPDSCPICHGDNGVEEW
jgi:hypothetical protein